MKHGFTLIEMIVAVTIMMVLLGGTIIGYTAYNDKQKIKQAALTVKSHMRLARTHALAGKKPISCEDTDTFAGYEITFSTSSYALTPLCESAGAVASERVTVTLPDGVVFSPVPSSFTYYPLTQGVSTPPNQIILTDGITTVTITVDPLTGDVVEQ